jgi:hypothetical protein
MSSVIAVHAVGNLETWLAEDNRPGLFKQFCSGYRLYRLPDQAKVAIVWENVDMAKLQRILGDAKNEAKAAKKADTVLDSIELFVELERAC